MKLSLNGLKQYIDIPADLPLERLAHDLTMKTVEVEGWDDLASSFDKIIVGKVLDLAPHPDADKLRVCQVDIGEKDSVQIVCGGSNLYKDQKVVVSLPGSFVVWHGEGEPVEIKESKLRGVPSFGMICSSVEVGLADRFPLKEEHEIIDLQGIDCEPGQNIADVLGISDCILEIDNKSLTNRPDLYCHYGMARELSAIYSLDLKPHCKGTAKVETLANLPKFPVRIAAEDACRRYVALEFENVTVQDSPTWLKSFLANVGMRPINLVVDLTNYVMLITGQPTHAFDREKLDGGITVRYAAEGEKLELLDEAVLELRANDLVIADEQKAIGLAGIMGGKHDSVSESTKHIVFEIANFSHSVVRNTMKHFDLRTESSIRFEKNLDTARVDMAIQLVLELFAELMPEAKLTAYSDTYPVDTGTLEVTVSKQFLETRSGRELSNETIRNMLEPLGFALAFAGDEITVGVPTWRATGDISMQDDILEEIARMLGYDSFEAVHPVVRLNDAINQKDHDLQRSIKEYLAFRCGFRELFTYPWVSDTYIKAAGMEGVEHIKLAAPPAPDMANIRSSLVPGMLSAIEQNLKYFDEFRIFELTQVFKKGEYSPSTKDEVLPVQDNHLVAACVGRDAAKIFYDLKGVVEDFSTHLIVEPLRFERREKPTWADKDAWLNIMTRSTVLGSIGLASKKTLSLAGIKHANAAIFEINTDALIPLNSRTNKFASLPQYPFVEQDLSILVNDDVKWSAIYKAIYASAKDIVFMDEYRGKQIPEGKKSVMFRVSMGSDSGTLKSEDVEKNIKEMISRLEKAVGAEIRH